MIKPPCRNRFGKDCKSRHVGCQSSCERYIEYRKDLDEENNKKRAKDDEKSFIFDCKQAFKTSLDKRDLRRY